MPANKPLTKIDGFIVSVVFARDKTLWCIGAPGHDVTGVGRTKIAIVAILGSIFAFARLRVAGVNGACVVVVTIRHLLLTLPNLGVAGMRGACVVVAAQDLLLTLPSRVTGVNGACVVVVALHLLGALVLRNREVFFALGWSGAHKGTIPR